ncbi:MAG: serine hydrolase domain-containing protein [Pseudorhizobium sp.]
MGLSLPLLTALTAAERDRLSIARGRAEQFVNEEVASLSIAVIHHGRPIWVEALGWADRKRGLRATPSTPYAIASASKPFTGMALAQLVEAQRIALDAPMQSYLKGISIRSRQGGLVTVRQAAQHRSGIPRHWRNFFAGQDSPPPFSSVARDHAFTTGAHGKRYLYSNTNYGLLAAAVEEVTGKPFHNYLEETIFRPLALTTAAPLQKHFSKWHAAVPYEADGNPIPPYLVDEQGARDLLMSASDLARFGLAHLDGRLGRVTARMIEERAELNANGVGRASYGLGWIIEEESPAALFSYGHTGEGPGAAASLTMVPGEKLVVATIANQQGPAAYLLNELIVDAMSTQFAARREAHPFQESAADENALNALDGYWEGQIELPSGLQPVSMILIRGGASRISLSQQHAELTNLNVREGVFTGSAALTIPTPSAQRWLHEARMLLERSGDYLGGTLAAYAKRGSVPHDQFWLSYPLRLEKRNP